MRVHNFYTVRLGDKTRRAYNAVAADFWTKAAAFTRWARYIALTATDGTCMRGEAELTAINCDVTRGGTLRATYAAKIKTDTKKYESASVFASESGDSVMSTAPLELEGTGDVADVTFTVYLEKEEGEGVCFCAGDNPLVKRLLGAGEESEYALAWGECDYPARPCVRTGALLGEKLYTVSDTDGESLRIKTDAAAYGCEAVLFCGAYPALRALRPYKTVVRTYADWADDRHALLIPDAYSAFSLSVDGTSITALDVKRVHEKAVAALSGKIVSLGFDGEVKSDPSEEYIVFVTTAFAEVYKVDSLDLTPLLRVEKTNEYVEIMRGGSLALWSDTALTIYEPDENGEYSSFETSFATGSDHIVMREGDRYHCAFRRSAAFYRYTVTRVGATLLSQTRITASRFLASRCGDAIAYGSASVYVRTCDTDISSEFACTVVSARTAVRTAAGHGDGFFLCGEEGATRLYDFTHNTDKPMEKGLKASGRLVYGADKAYVYDCYNGLCELDGDYDASGAQSACIAGSGLFVLRDGDLYAYYLSGSDLSVRLPASSNGKIASCNVRSREYEGVGQSIAFLLGGA